LVLFFFFFFGHDVAGVPNLGGKAKLARGIRELVTREHIFDVVFGRLQEMEERFRFFDKVSTRGSCNLLNRRRLFLDRLQKTIFYLTTYLLRTSVSLNLLVRLESKNATQVVKF
jgi:hypothetical protein